MMFSKQTGIGINIESNTKGVKAPVSFYSLQARTITGEMISFERYRNKKIMLINVASRCGYTPQYTDLEKTYNQNNNLILLGFPSDDFGGQEPGSNEEIAEFCKVNFGVTFPLFYKDHVKGSDKQPVYHWLSNAGKNGWNNKEPSWNFCKYLVDERGQLMYFFTSPVSPLSDEVLSAIGSAPSM